MNLMSWLLRLTTRVVFTLVLGVMGFSCLFLALLKWLGSDELKLTAQTYSGETLEYALPSLWVLLVVGIVLVVLAWLLNRVRFNMQPTTREPE